MKGEAPILSVTFEAGATLARYTAVTLDAAGKVVAPAAGAAILGILQVDVDPGQAAPVMVAGFSFAKVSGAAAPMTNLVPAADGTFVTGVAAATAGVTVLNVNPAVAGDTVAVYIK